MGVLAGRRTPFAIRLKENWIVEVPCETQMALGSLFRKTPARQSIQASLSKRQGHLAPGLHSVAKRIKGGATVIIASSEPDLGPVQVYRKRWVIDCLFGDAMTRGLNLENARLTITSDAPVVPVRTLAETLPRTADQDISRASIIRGWCWALSMPLQGTLKAKSPPCSTASMTKRATSSSGPTPPGPAATDALAIDRPKRRSPSPNLDDLRPTRILDEPVQIQRTAGGIHHDDHIKH